MLPPECQVCDNFDVQRTWCCGAWTFSTHYGVDISDFVRAEYGRRSGVDYGLFRLLNDDLRYELRSLYEDTTVWSAYYKFRGTKRENLPPAATRMAQTSAFVHIRLLSSFLTVDDNDSNETRATAFGVKVQQPTAGLIAWRDAINSNVMHLHKLRPRPVVVVDRKTWRTRTAAQHVQHDVANLTDEVVRLWRTFTADAMTAPYAKLTEHIERWAEDGAAAARAHLTGLLGVADAVMWRPPPK